MRNIFVYDFQESPTGELADYTFSTESSGQDASEEKASDHELQPDADLEAQSCETFCVSEETDGNNSEEGEFVEDIKLRRIILVDLSRIVHDNCDCVCVHTGGGYEWENDLSFEPHPSSPDTIPEPQSSPTPTSNSPEAPKPAAVALNRFMVSRFSITHVSDSHMGSATGLY